MPQVSDLPRIKTAEPLGVCFNLIKTRCASIATHIDLRALYAIEATHKFIHMEASIAAGINESFESPEETRNVDKGKVEVLNLSGMQVMRATFQPGWKWSECVKPIAGTDSCQVAHLVYTVSGKMNVRMDDGSVIQIKRGDVTVLPPGHDAWIVGDETYVGIDFQGAAEYAKAAH